MNITEVRVKLVRGGGGAERLRAFCSITIDNLFVIRDLKIIDGVNGPFVAMPSRKLMDHCPKCSGKNHLRARFCNDCGTALAENRAPRDEHGQIALHADIAHPINAAGREQLQDVVIAAYRAETEQSGADEGMSDSVPHRDSPFESEYDELIADLKSSAANRRERDTGRNGMPRMESEHAATSTRQDASSAPRSPQRTPPKSSASAAPRRSDDPFSAGL